jgi:hypothetical protein
MDAGVYGMTAVGGNCCEGTAKVQWAIAEEKRRGDAGAAAEGGEEFGGMEPEILKGLRDMAGERGGGDEVGGAKISDGCDVL